MQQDFLLLEQVSTVPWSVGATRRADEQTEGTTTVRKIGMEEKDRRGGHRLSIDRMVDRKVGGSKGRQEGTGSWAGEAGSGTLLIVPACLYRVDIER